MTTRTTRRRPPAKPDEPENTPAGQDVPHHQQTEDYGGGHIQARRYQQKGQSLEKCLQILNGLNGALDHDNGGEVVQGLARLYDYCIYRISDVSVTLSLEGLDEVTGLLGVLREGWEGVNAKRG